jgi:Mce-associated membrane protein
VTEPSATEPWPAGTDVSPDGDLTHARRRPLAGLVAAVVVVALLAAGVGYLGLRLRTEAATDSARTEAVAASRDASRLLFSYDFKTLQDDFARGLAVTTGAFREEYSRTTRDVVSDVATRYKAVVLADVVESAVITASPSKVTTLVFLNQATTSTRVEGQQIDGSRVRMVLEKRDGRWLVSAVDAL